jgi:hypothetical protein
MPIGARVTRTHPSSLGIMRAVTKGVPDQRAQRLDLGFATFDTLNAPVLALINDTLLMTWVDPSVALVSARFENVIAFSWTDELGDLLDGEQYDLSFEVIESEWLAEHRTRMGAPLDGYRHLKVNFTNGGLDVLCTATPTVTRRSLWAPEDPTTAGRSQDSVDRALRVLERAAVDQAETHMFEVVEYGMPPTSWQVRCRRCGASPSRRFSEDGLRDWVDHHQCPSEP